MSDRENHTEEELSAFRAGDQTAVAEMFGLFGDGVYSYFLARAGDEEVAAGATVETFSLASQSTGGVEAHDPAVLLFAGARHVARKRGMSFDSPGDDDAGGLRGQALQAVAGLGVRDRELMMLVGVGRLDDQQIADVVGLDTSHADEILTRARRRISGALGPLLVARFGVGACGDLRSTVGDWDGTFSDTDRAKVNRHVATCEVCSRVRADLVAPDGVLPALLTVGAPDTVREAVLDALVVEAGPVTEEEPEPPPVAVPPPGPPTSVTETHPDPDLAAASTALGMAERDSKDPMMLGVFALVAVVLGLLGFLVAGRFDPLDPPPVTTMATTATSGGPGSTTSTPSTSTTTRDRATSTSTASAQPATFQLSVDSVDFADDATTGRFEIVNSGGETGEARITSSSDAVLLASGVVELGPGESLDFEIGLDRETVSEGEIDELITITWQGGSAEVAVTGSQIDNPIIHNPGASPSTVQVEGQGCSSTRTTVSAKITDTSSFEAVVRWSPDGGATRETAMMAIGSDVYEAVIGPFTVAQTSGARIVAIDELGNAGGASVTIDVQPCG